jgi:hypothetical protein
MFTTTYSVTIKNPYTGNGVMDNVVVALGHRLTCQDGKGPGCATSVTIGRVHVRTGFGGMAGAVRYHYPRP